MSYDSGVISLYYFIFFFGRLLYIYINKSCRWLGRGSLQLFTLLSFPHKTVKLAMDPNAVQEDIPDPFEVGDDELDDELEPPSLVPEVPPTIVESTSDGPTGMTQEIGIDSRQQSVTNLAQEIPRSKPPSPPPKEDVPSTARLPLVMNLQPLLAPSLFLPIPEVCCLPLPRDESTNRTVVSGRPFEDTSCEICARSRLETTTRFFWRLHPFRPADFSRE